MAKITGGLSSFDEDGSTSDNAVPITEAVNIGGAKVPLKTALNSDIVKNLQEEIDKRTGGINPLLRGMERAVAITSRDPGSAMSLVGAQQRAEDESIFNMRNSIASIKAAQQQAAARSAQWNAMNSQGGAGQGAPVGGAGQGAPVGGAGQAAPVGGTGQAQANTGAGVTISPEQLAIEQGLETPDEKIAARNRYLGQITQANARGQAEAAGNKQEEYKDPRTGATIGYFTPNQVKANPSLIGGAVVTGNTAPAAKSKPGVSFTPTNNTSFDDAARFVFSQEGGYKDKDGNTGNPVNMGINQKFHPGVDVSTLTPDQARDIYKKEYWDAIGADKLNPAAAKIAFDAAVNQGPDYAKRLIAETGGDPDKMMAHRMGRYADIVAGDKTGEQAKNLKGWMGRLDNLRSELGQAKPNPAAEATSTTTPGLSPIEQHKLDIKKADIAAEANKSGLEEEKKKAADYMAAIQSGRKDLPSILSSSQNIQKHATQNPGAFFYPGQGGVLGGATALPVVGEGVGDVYASLSGDAKTRAEIGQSAKSLGVENAKNLFAGMAARFGAQLTGIGTSSKGVGLDLPAETNKFNARAMELTAYMADDQAKAFEKYQKTGGDAFQFLNSEENKAIEQRYLGALQREFPNRIKLDNRPPAEPKVGDVMGGHRYKGGGAHLKENWEKV
jgi:hypothetical protein